MGFLFFFFKPTFAEVLINEVQIEPEQSVELWNTASESANISGWYLDDNGGSTFFTIPENTFIYPTSCLVFTANFYLNKTSADIIRLFSNATPPTSTSATLIDNYAYDKSPGNNFSFARAPNASTTWVSGASTLGKNNSLLENCLLLPTSTPTLAPTPTPTPQPTTALTPTSIPTVVPTQTPEAATPTPLSEAQETNIMLSEVLINPETGSSEWVEIYNKSDENLTLTDWYLDDAENEGSTAKKFNLQISAKSYAVFELSSAIYNNAGDKIRLLNNSFKEIDATEYTNAPKNQSLNRSSFDSDSALWCYNNPSKNSTNFACPVNTAAPSTPTPAGSILGISSVKNNAPLPKNTLYFSSDFAQNVTLSLKKKPSHTQTASFSAKTKIKSAVSILPILNLLRQNLFVLWISYFLFTCNLLYYSYGYQKERKFSP